MRRSVLSIIAVVESRDKGYADFPASCLDEETEGELAEFGYAIGLSDAMWFGGYRVYGPESIAAGNYRPHVPPSALTCADLRCARVPDAGDFDFESVLKVRGIIPTN
jgi:hypothetical protein